MSETCPQCESPAVRLGSDTLTLGYGACGDCGALWETLDRQLLSDPNDPLSAFTEPCDNCAFRPGSAEQQDSAGWLALIAQLKEGGRFFCHKGVPMKLPDRAGGHYGFDYPQREVEIAIEGETVVTTVPDASRLRPCAGFLKALAAKQLGDAL